MVDENYTHMRMIVDRSGSMGKPIDSYGFYWDTKSSGKTVATEMVKAMDEFFAEQAKVEGTCLVDYAQFDNVHEMVFEDTPVGDARAVINPRNSTALNDAIGKGIEELGRKLRNMPESRRPGKVMVVIVTDGLENSSTRYTKNKVRELIEHQTEKYGWNFVFLGANMDAVAEGAGYGIGADSSLTYNTNDVYAASASLGSYTTTYRGTGNAAFSAEDREANATKS